MTMALECWRTSAAWISPGRLAPPNLVAVNAFTGKQEQHAWFTGFVPYDDPTFVVTVYFDLGIGGTKAAPVAGEILRYAMENVTP